MPLPIEQEKKIMTILHDLPDEKLNEVIDYAEYLREKVISLKAKQKKTSLNLPTFHLGRIEPHALDRDGIYGEHIDRKLA